MSPSAAEKLIKSGSEVLLQTKYDEQFAGIIVSKPDRYSVCVAYNGKIGIFERSELTVVAK